MTFAYEDKKTGKKVLCHFKKPLTDKEEEIKGIIAKRQLVNEQIIYEGGSGSGKTVAIMSHIEARVDIEKSVVICVTGKRGNEFDFGFCAFEPYDKAQIEFLKRIKIQGKARPVKLYHPFCFDNEIHNKKSEIKYKKLPPINFYTHSLKDIDDRGWMAIVEKEEDRDYSKVCYNVAQKLKSDEGIFEFLHLVNEYLTEHPTESYNVGNEQEFFLPKKMMGDRKTMERIKDSLTKFYSNYFLQSNDCPYNLDFKKILNDAEHYHVFGRQWIKNRSVWYFDVVHILLKLMETMNNYNDMPYPVILVFEEIRYILPRNDPTATQKILGSLLKEILSTGRDKGKGITTFATTQLDKDTSEDYVSSCTTKMIGIMNPADLKILAKDFGFEFNAEKLRKIRELKTGQWIYWDDEEKTRFQIYYPSHSIKVEGDTFFETYKRLKPDEMVLHSDVYDYFKKEREEKSVMTKKKVQIYIEKKKQEMIAKQVEKEKKKNPELEVKAKIEELKLENKDLIKKHCYEKAKELFESGIKFSWREVARRSNISRHETAKKYAIEYGEKIEDKNFISAILGK